MEPSQATDSSLFQLPLGIAILLVLFAGFVSPTNPDTASIDVEDTPMFAADTNRAPRQPMRRESTRGQSTFPNRARAQSNICEKIDVWTGSDSALVFETHQGARSPHWLLSAHGSTASPDATLLAASTRRNATPITLCSESIVLENAIVSSDTEPHLAMAEPSLLTRGILRLGGPSIADSLRRWVFQPLGMRKTSEEIVAAEDKRQQRTAARNRNQEAPAEPRVRLLFIREA